MLYTYVATTGKGDMSYLTLSDMKEQIRQHYVDRENMRIETATVKAQVRLKLLVYQALRY
jgi:hypothetical protein